MVSDIGKSASGTLFDLSLTSGGAINGTPTTTGTYSFTVQAADSDNPPQTATGVFTIRVDP